MWLMLLKKYWYAIPLVGALLYHFYEVNSLEKELLTIQKDYSDLNASYSSVLKINSDNNITISGLQKDVSTITESKDIIIQKKTKTIESISKILNETKKVKYEHTYTYDKCTFKVKGDDNESNELYRTISSIGK